MNILKETKIKIDIDSYGNAFLETKRNIENDEGEFETITHRGPATQEDIAEFVNLTQK